MPSVLKKKKKKVVYIQCWRIFWEISTLKYNEEEGNLTISIKILPVYTL